MDVKEIQAAALSGLAGKRGKQEEPEGADFQKLLQQAQSNQKTGGATDSDRSSGAGGPKIYDPALSVSALGYLTGLGGTSAGQRDGALASERALAVLERYQMSLGDSKRPLQEIRPTVESLSAELEQLAQRAGELSSSDPLRKIMTEIAILSSVEIEKFNRGDYR